MGKAIMGAVVSVDGYIADTDGDVGPLFDWYGGGDVEWKFTEKQGQPCRTTKASRDQVVMNLVPVVFGGGHPFFGSMGSGDVVTLANPSRVVQGDRVTRLLYDVERTTFQGEAARC